MKKEIIAYITALTDVQRHTVNMPITECLDNLIDFIEDIPEEKQESIKNFNIALENEDLKKCNAQLLNINKKLYKEVENLDIALTLSKSVMDPIFKENFKKYLKGLNISQ